jgi:tetratricopeptide (TPR) repeat protein
VEVEYFYNNSAGPTAKLYLETEQGAKQHSRAGGMAFVRPGRNKVNIRLNRGFVFTNPEELRDIMPDDLKAPLHTKSIKASLKSRSETLLAEGSFATEIVWPSSDRFVLSGPTAEEIDRVYRLCVQAIDRGEQFDSAKKGLEQIVLANPEYVPAYVELARYHMKTNWSPAGLGQAERSLMAALRIAPEHANSLVLLGYVYTHQRRFREAEATFKKAETIGTRNIWLYANWGELRAMEGKKRAAIEMYRRAIDAPVDLETYERARRDAYEKALMLLTEGKQWQDAEKLYQERNARYPDNGCLKAMYAAFRMNRMGDPDGAIEAGTKAHEQGCDDERVNTQLILASAYYVKWASSLGKAGDGREVEHLYNRGQALYSDMTMLLYSMAGSKYSVAVIPALKKKGIKIDTPDRNGFTALGQSILNHDVAAASALIRHGANVNQTFTPDGITPLMLASAGGSKELVVLLLKNGADKRRKTTLGINAERIAIERGFKDIAGLLSGQVGI